MPSNKKDVRSTMERSPEEIAPFSLIVKFPFTRLMNKNGMWKRSKKGYMYMPTEVKSCLNMLIIKIKQADVESKTFLLEEEKKVWLDILIRRPSMKSDPINFLDLICDAVKKAINIDDRWFAIYRLDWEVNKTNPEIIIKIWQ